MKCRTREGMRRPAAVTAVIGKGGGACWCRMDDLAGGQHIGEQLTRVMGDAEAGEDRAADMLGIIGAERSATVDRDLAAVDLETPPDDIALVDIADPLVGAQLVQRLRRAVLGNILKAASSWSAKP